MEGIVGATAGTGHWNRTTTAETGRVVVELRGLVTGREVGVTGRRQLGSWGSGQCFGLVLGLLGFRLACLVLDWQVPSDTDTSSYSSGYFSGVFAHFPRFLEMGNVSTPSRPRRRRAGVQANQDRPDQGGGSKRPSGMPRPNTGQMGSCIRHQALQALQALQA